MITISNERAAQLELDFEIDRGRLDLQEWHRAIDRNLHALTDYVDPHQLIIWQPGNRRRGTGKTTEADRKALDVQVSTITSCTCSRFKLRDRCEHVAFAARLESAGIVPGSDTPVRAIEIN